MIGDVITRWNSTAELIKRALDLRAALDRLILMDEFNKPKGVRLARFRLSPTEWKILQELAPVLDVSLFLHIHGQHCDHHSQTVMYATKKISASAVPLIHQVIPLIDSITTHFDSVIDDSTLSLAVCHAALRGILLLNKYYARTDDATVYRIAMSMFLIVFYLLLVLITYSTSSSDEDPVLCESTVGGSMDY